MTTVDWNSLTVVKLKEELKKRNLSTNGLKKDLVQRLEEYDEAGGSGSAEGDGDNEAAAAADLPETPAKGGKERRKSTRVGRKGSEVQEDKDNGENGEQNNGELSSSEDRTRHDAPDVESEVKENENANDIAMDDAKNETKAEQDPSLSSAKRKSPSDSEEPKVAKKTKTEEVNLTDGLENKAPENEASHVNQKSDIKSEQKRDVEIQGEEKLVGEKPSSPTKKRNDAVKDQQSDPSTSSPQSAKEMTSADKAAAPVSTANGVNEKHADPESGTTENDESSTEKESLQPSSTLVIRNFIRPLTVQQVKELLASYGKVENFWMDKIKTHCYVTYENTNQAAEAFAGCDNLKFPPDTGKNLTVEYMTEEAATAAIAEEENAQRRNSDTNNPPGRFAAAHNPLHRLAPPPARIERPPFNPPPPPPAYNPPPLRRDARPNDAMFRKTKTQPSIYYRPHSEDEVRAKRRRLEDDVSRDRREPRRRSRERSRSRERRSYGRGRY
ncbi:hypothetical protein, variant [Spizellomyces punctatus DAOM BR117]|uniref:SAP domain-containing protein n=1 Tax=Spizellomyces punctatus (strain DAOM BR117) TaxID=645134 RepID=A0A0L0HSZ3_SPIPD|nr:hypothetical protein, variant [Spizellomyces punctatus DAOM BR117]KND04192.1 hypothetical protein, variant [Spizellomyces punctatus DAOM BR117]|eukprot:XP_016612231.1 hypothetical protein, variant [Spizellomyces punctatus DAOM BR117]